MRNQSAVGRPHRLTGPVRCASGFDQSLCKPPASLSPFTRAHAEDGLLSKLHNKRRGMAIKRMMAGTLCIRCGAAAHKKAWLRQRGCLPPSGHKVLVATGRNLPAAHPVPPTYRSLPIPRRSPCSSLVYRLAHTLQSGLRGDAVEKQSVLDFTKNG